MRLIVGMTGATGAPFGVRLLEVLRDLADVETHLVMSRWARTTIELETSYSVREVAKLADVVYTAGDQAAAISSGSFLTAGMVIVPCSMKTLAGIRTGYAEGLVARAADVCLKERRRLVVVPRETPLSDVHLENMLALSRMGATIFPPVPAFYNHPESLADMIDHLVVRILDQFGMSTTTARRWSGLPGKGDTPPHPEDHRGGVAVPMAFVSIRAGRPPEKIRAMISAVTAAIAESLDAPVESIRVVVTEVPPTHWATGDVTLAEKGRPDAGVPASGKPATGLDPGDRPR